MADRQFTAPHLVSKGNATTLTRVPLFSKRFSESWFQSLLFENPALLPINELEPAFDGSVPLARELPTEAGPVDLVYINPKGFITLVETKLFRNPEARRQVVAQIVDYATAMSKWSYTNFQDAVKRATPQLTKTTPADPILAAVQTDPDFDASTFHDTVSRNLSRGRFLLLIAGDGIQESVEHLAETLARSPHLGFTLALVELAVFSMPDSDKNVLVQPRTLARTREIVRAVVELRPGVSPSDITITLPPPPPPIDRPRPKLTEDAFFDELKTTTSDIIATDFNAFLEELEAIGVETKFGDSSLSLLWFDPNTDHRFTFGFIRANGGRVDLGFVTHYLRKAKLDESLGHRYTQAVAKLVPGSTVKNLAGAKGFKYSKVLLNGAPITLKDLLPHSKAWLAAIQSAMHDYESATATLPD